MKPLDSNKNSYDNVTNENDVTVNRDDLVPLNDPECEHKVFKPEGEDIDGYTSWTCQGCGRGAILPHGVNII